MNLLKGFATIALIAIFTGGPAYAGLGSPCFTSDHQEVAKESIDSVDGTVRANVSLVKVFFTCPWEESYKLRAKVELIPLSEKLLPNGGYIRARLEGYSDEGVLIQSMEQFYFSLLSSPFNAADIGLVTLTVDGFEPLVLEL